MRDDPLGTRCKTTRQPWVVCIECGHPSDPKWRGWRAYRVDEPSTDDAPELAFYCPACARAEFDSQDV